MTHSPLANGIQITSDSSPRGSRIDRFIVHHAATTSLAAILSLFQPGGRTVSANYALGNDGTLILAVDEDLRAWTSASAYWDGRAVTIEVANSQAGGSWPVSDASFDKLARLIADVSTRHGFPVNDDTVLTHQELYTRYGDSYATACPGDLQRRKGELIGKANYYRAFPSGKTPQQIEEEELMAAKDEIINALVDYINRRLEVSEDRLRREARLRLYKNTETNEMIAVHPAGGAYVGPWDVTKYPGKADSLRINYRRVGDTPAQAYQVPDQVFANLLKDLGIPRTGGPGYGVTGGEVPAIYDDEAGQPKYDDAE